MMNSILLVEDEADVSAVFQSFLGRRGFTVSATASGVEALRLIPVLKPDLVLLDITLSDSSGIDILKTLRETDTATKVIIITGQMFLSDKVAAIRELGIVDYLEKPIVLSRLEEIVTRVLGGEIMMPKLLPKTAEAVPFDRHRLMNVLGVMRGKCESFVLDVEDGFLDKMPERAQRDKAIQIMKDLIRSIEELTKK
ncbi:MAG: response regulator [Candidatus Omnitrophica bacterium]|nr:response regulator [Candidatus Omnitrophota bacterium]